MLLFFIADTLWHVKHVKMPKAWLQNNLKLQIPNRSNILWLPRRVMLLSTAASKQADNTELKK